MASLSNMKRRIWAVWPEKISLVISICYFQALTLLLLGNTPDVNTRHLLEISNLYGLKQLINEPTRITESSSTLIIQIGWAALESPILASAIIASSMFIENFFLIHHLKDILLSLIEISEILIEKSFEMKFLNKTGLPMNMKIQICYGLTEKQNFCALSTLMLRFELDVLNWIIYPGLIQHWRMVCAVGMRLKRRR